MSDSYTRAIFLNNQSEKMLKNNFKFWAPEGAKLSK